MNGLGGEHVKVIENFVNPIACLSSANNVLKLITFILLVIIIILSISLYVVSSKNQIVVAINDSLPISLNIIDDSIANLINYKQFVIHFLSCLYNWNPDTFYDQTIKATNLMGNNIRKDYIALATDKAYITNIINYRITNAFQVSRMDEKSVISSNVFKLVVYGTKLRITEFIDRTTEVAIVLTIKTIPATKNNIWGLEVIGIEEGEV